MEPHAEAIQIFARVTETLTSPNRDLETSLRLCLHACILLDWEVQGQWFDHELNGYPQESIPAHRKARGVLQWTRVGDPLPGTSALLHPEIKPPPQRDVILDLCGPIDWIIERVQSPTDSGFRRDTGRTKRTRHPSTGKTIQWRGSEYYPASSFAAVLFSIERQTFIFASRSYVQLKFGQAISGIWADYRDCVETSLRGLGFEDHLSAIQAGIESENPQSWRSAVFGCRSLLNDLANYLWQDPCPTYVHLPGQGENDKLEVSQGKFANRLTAYLHQKGMSGTKGRFVRDEIKFLAEVIRSLIACQSEAHEPIGPEDARSVVLATYFVVGELVIRTDMRPVFEYGEVTGEG